MGTNSSIGKRYKKDSFKWKKFIDNFSLGNGRKWGKALSDIVDLRRWVIRIIIFLILFGGYFYYQGRIQAPVKFNFDYATELTLKIPRGSIIMHKPANSSTAYWINESGKRTEVKVKDIPELKELLKPIGFEVTPIGVVGVGIGGNGSGFEGGAGIRFLRVFKLRAETFLTNKGIYIGASYQITSNSGVGIAPGKGFKGDNRIMLYWVVKF